MVKNIIQREMSYFFALSKKAQRLLISYFFYGLANPLVFTFINAYIFRQRVNILNFIIYYFGFFVGIPLMFYINGLLLAKRIKIVILYFLGTILMGISPLIVVFYPHINFFHYFILGFIAGLGTGFHWANRSYFNQKETQSHNRGYFLSLNFSSDTITSVIISFLAGWLIVLGFRYQALMIIGFLFLLICGSLMIGVPYETPKIKKFIINIISPEWWGVRFIQFGNGLVEGITFFFIALLILSKLGNEGALGTLSALMSLISAAGIYIYGRKVRVHHQLPTYLYTVIVGVILSLFLALFFNKLGVTVYVLLDGVVLSFLWLTVGPITMNVIDRQTIQEKGGKYVYIVDAETFLNIGRILSLTICLLLTLFFNQNMALRFSPILLNFLLLVMLLFSFKKLKSWEF